MGTITRNFANNILGTGEVDATDGVNGTISATNVADASLNNVTSLPSSVGYAVKSVASDPPSLNAGEIFYNSTAGAFKALVNVEAWSSGSSIGTGRYGAASLGSQTANLFCGGSTLPFGTQTICEEYNGSGWATAGGLGTTRYMLQGAGTVSAGLVFGGNYPARKNETEEYNGTTWSEQNNLNTARRLPGGSGTQTDALAIAGDDGGPGGALVTSVVEEYNGTSWTEVNNVPTAVRGGCAIGNSTPVSMFFGGYTGTERIGTTVEYDGTNWTAGGNMVNGGNEMMGSGTQTAGLTFGGTRPGVTTATEKYDGTSWTTAPATLATAVYAQGGSGPAGTSSAALNTSGRTPSSPAGTKLGTEEFNSSTNTITAAAWASGGALGTVRNVLAGAGIQTAALMIGGNNPGTTQKGNVEEYDGSSYSEINDLTTARSQGGSAGTSTAALFFGGDVYPASPRDTAKTEEYNGSSWSEQNDMVGTARRALIGFGTQTAAVGAAGYGGGILAPTRSIIFFS